MMLFDDVKKTQLGQTVTLAPKEEAAVIRAYGPDHMAQMVTVQMSVVDIDRLQFTSNPVLRVSAKIRWGIAGQQDNAEVDVLGGAMVSVPCSFIEVVARNDSFRPAAGINQPEPGIFNATVSASVGYGARAPTGLPGAFRTVEYVTTETPNLIGGPTPGATSKQLIPRWASAAAIVFQPSNASVVVVVSDTNRSIYTVVAASGDTFPLVAPAYQIHVENTVGAPTITALRIQYALLI